jgi:large subunit ribosomal protein L24
MATAHIKKDDLVIVTTGAASFRGQTGKVLRVLPKKNQVIVQGLRMITKSTKATQTNQGGLIKREGPIHISNVKKVTGDEKPAAKAAKAAKAPAAAKPAAAKKKAAAKPKKSTDES